MSKQPVISINRFADEWEQHKLGELMNVTSVKRIHQSDWTTSGVRFLRARDIVSAAKNEEQDDCLYISEEKYKEYSAISGKVRVGDLLVTGVGTIGIPFLIENNEPLYFKDGNIIWFQNNEAINGNFFYYSFWSQRIQNYISESAGIGTVGTYTIDSGKKTPIHLPSKAEQIGIGELFYVLDKLISLHQRKYDKLLTYKKAMLEKMFPKDGADVPEVRFVGFKTAWKKYALSEIATEITRNDPLSTAPIMMITAKDGFIEQSERYAFDNAGESLKKYTLLKKDELAYNHGASKLRPYGSCFALKNADEARIPFVYHCFSVGDNNSDFLSVQLNGAYIEKQLRRIVSSSARMDGLLNISYEEYTTVQVMMPEIDEQNKIAEFFHDLDRLISFNADRIEKLKALKTALLEKMFI